MLARGGRRPEATVPPRAADRVLLDAPCSGLGVLRRRADARWRIDADAPDRLAVLQRDLVDAAVPLVRPGGLFVYSVCTLTVAESTDIDQPPRRPPPGPGRAGTTRGPVASVGPGRILLPQTAGTDGMCMFRYRRR